MRLNDILDKVSEYAPNADLDVIMRAYVFSAKAHAGQVRKSGEPYLTHPLAVAQILADMKMDVDTIATGLLHDTMEDCLVTPDEIKELFGDEVSELVDGVTKIGKLEFRSKEEAQAENFRKMVLAMAKDIRVVLVKLADRLHNMRTMQHMRADRQKAISQETLDIFAPIANRLGLSQIKQELEELCFEYLHGDVYAEMVEKLATGAADRNVYIEETSKTLYEMFAEKELQCVITGRSKHLFSVYRKMLAQNLEFEQVHDLLAFRVFVNDIGECYTALGLTHARFRHFPNKLKDYIANPKSNGYQSLHTVVIGPDNQQIEIQIRTHQMHAIAEVGIAAHWRYKEGHLALSREDMNKVTKLRELFEAAREVEDPQEFLETVKVDLFATEAFAFTPRGDVKFFPLGATALDFAFSIHTEVGNKCVGVKINGRMVPLRYELKSGDTVEILTREDQRPSRDWLDIAKTGRALSKIRREIRQDERAKGREIGHNLLETEFKKFKANLNRRIKAGDIRTVCKELGYRKEDDLYLAIAQGRVTVERIARMVLPADVFEKQQEEPGAITQLFQRIRKKSESPVLINGVEDVMVTYAKCCRPVPGEPVTGYVTRGRGITIHLATCKQVMAMDSERRVSVQWHNETRGKHSGEVRIICSDQMGMLAEIGTVCKTTGINVTRMEANQIEDNKAELSLEVAIEDVRELEHFMNCIERVKGVISVDRVRAQAQV
ncbi:MAG: GTP pyrophosphokinase [Deltaproteobacteria bacterium]|nr:GTP pyrophosphokinase [Deltaproteobacteria bacterium]